MQVRLESNRLYLDVHMHEQEKPKERGGERERKEKNIDMVDLIRRTM